MPSGVCQIERDTEEPCAVAGKEVTRWAADLIGSEVRCVGRRQHFAVWVQPKKPRRHNIRCEASLAVTDRHAKKERIKPTLFERHKSLRYGEMERGRTIGPWIIASRNRRKPDRRCDREVPVQI